MRRMSAVGSLEFCGQADKLAKNVQSTAALRSTCFHKYAETGKWPEEIKRLPEVDVTEISRWKTPKDLNHPDGFALRYHQADKERLVCLDNNLNYLEIPNDTKQEDLESNPDIFLAGHLDMAWDFPELDLVVIVDIKSSIFAVKDRGESLQLHAYGFAYAKLKGRNNYLPGIWDASDAKYFFGKKVTIGSFEHESIGDRLKIAGNNNDPMYTKGTHCASCWKRDSCPAHLVDLPGDDRFAKLFNGEANEALIREAIIEAKRLFDRGNKLQDLAKSWVDRRGPVRSEDGRKEYKVQLRSGKKSLDTSKVMAALNVNSLDEYMKQGDDYAAYDWRLVKKD